MKMTILKTDAKTALQYQNDPQIICLVGNLKTNFELYYLDYVFKYFSGEVSIYLGRTLIFRYQCPLNLTILNGSFREAFEKANPFSSKVLAVFLETLTELLV